MAPSAPYDRPNQRELVHHPRGERKMLTDLNARDVGVDGRELATNFQGSIRLEIHHVLVRRTACQVDHNDRLTGVANSSLCLGTQDVGHREPAYAEGADLQAFHSIVTRLRTTGCLFEKHHAGCKTMHEICATHRTKLPCGKKASQGNFTQVRRDQRSIVVRLAK